MLDPDEQPSHYLHHCRVSVWKGINRIVEQGEATIAGFILELPDGSREFVGVALDTQTLNTGGWVIRGLQTLLTQGNAVDISVKPRDGYFDMLDAIFEVSPGEQ